MRHAQNAVLSGKEDGRKSEPRMLFPRPILGECKASVSAEPECIQTYMRFDGPTLRHADNAARTGKEDGRKLNRGCLAKGLY